VLGHTHNGFHIAKCTTTKLTYLVLYWHKTGGAITKLQKKPPTPHSAVPTGETGLLQRRQDAKKNWFVRAGVFSAPAMARRSQPSFRFLPILNFSA
jgi:hypothetical protein